MRIAAMIAGIAGVGRAIWLLAQGRVATAPDYTVIGGCVLIALSAVARSGAPGLATGALMVLLGLAWSAPTVSFPAIDAARPWGMDWDPTPLTHPPTLLALVLLLVGGAGAVGTWKRRLAFRAPLLLVAGGLVTWWSTPRWFEMDLIAPEGVVADLPSFLPQPGDIGAGDTPAFVGGTLRHLHWSQYSYEARPILALDKTLHRELAVAAIAHGMRLEAAPGTEVQRRVRAGLWRAQNALVATWLGLHVACVAVVALLALWGLTGRGLTPRLGAVTRLTLAITLALPSAVNLLFSATLAALGVGDVRTHGLEVALIASAELACVGLLLHAGSRATRWVNDVP